MTDRDIIHDYLKSFSKYLARLDRAEAAEVIREIESHIFDAWEQAGDAGDIRSVLDGFGPPRQLASAYVEHILEGAPPPPGFRAIQIVKKGAGKGLYYSMAVVGYFMSLTLILLGIMKPFSPGEIGVWLAEHGQSIAVGARSDVPPGAVELLGWWFVPVAICLGFGAAYLTHNVLRALKGRI